MAADPDLIPIENNFRNATRPTHLFSNLQFLLQQTAILGEGQLTPIDMVFSVVCVKSRQGIVVNHLVWFK